MKSRLCLCCLYLLAPFLIHCAIINSSRTPDELILFAAIGTTPFTDTIYTIQTDGSYPKRLLTPQGKRSYLHASGYSLKQGLTVSIHQSNINGQVEDHIFVYRPSADEWRRLVSKAGLEGESYMSPDGKYVAFAFAPQSQLRVWLANLETNQIQKLTEDDSEQNSWDRDFSWRLDSREIIFIRSWLGKGSTTSALLRIPLPGGKPIPLLERRPRIGAACYSPNGEQVAVFAEAGLEVLDVEGQTRAVILPWNKLPDRGFQNGGLCWSAKQNILAFGMYNNKTKAHEIWTVSRDGSNAKAIYSSKDMLIKVTSFIRQ